ASRIRTASTVDMPLVLIDVGAGEGTTTYALMNRLLTNYKRPSTAFLIEPSPAARAASGLRFASPRHRFGTAQICSDITDIPKQTRADAILFIHSSYYIMNIENHLRVLITQNLKKQGIVLFLVLGKGSPFFLGEEARWARTSPDNIVTMCEDLGLQVETLNLTSRITVPSGLWDDDEVVGEWQRFLGYDDWTRDQMRRGLRRYLTDGTDLRDVLIVGANRRR